MEVGALSQIYSKYAFKKQVLTKHTGVKILVNVGWDVESFDVEKLKEIER